VADAWKEKADERLTHVFTKELDEGAAFVTGWVAIVTYVDSDSQSCVAFNYMEDQRRHQTLGMLQHALAVETANIFWDERSNQ